MQIKTALEVPKVKLVQLLKATALNGGGAYYIPPVNPAKNHACLVCHIDTVWDHIRNGENARIYHDSTAGVYWSPDGLGADDRAGLWACAELKRKTGCAVLLCDGEELGGWGARDAVKHFFNELILHRYFLEIDRKGKGEFVCYNNEPKKFRNFIKAFGFKEHSGSFSDISIICSSLKIPGANLSAGYHGEHTRSEFLVMKDLEYTIRQAEKIIKSTPPDSWGEWNRERGVKFFEYDKKMKDTPLEYVYDLAGWEDV